MAVEGREPSVIGMGWVVLLGICASDDDKDIQYMVDKILNLRAFSDQNGKFNLSVEDVGGSILVVSQFTLYGDCRAGRRPSFSAAAPAAVASSIYERFMSKLRAATSRTLKEGVFQAHMQVSLCNDGPVTLLLDSKKEF